jgi:nucleoid-associated protein
MEVIKIIIHLIDKEQGTNPRLDKSLTLLTIEANINVLAEKLNDAFKKDSRILRTEFLEEVNVFQEGVSLFSLENNDENFFNLSSNSLDRMGDLMVGNNFATGGYFVYINYVYRSTNYLGVFIVRDSEEIIFKKVEDSENFIVNTTTIVDTNKLAMAVRIDLDKLVNGEDRYLHFTHRQQHLSAYFITWIEADLAEKSIEDTTKFIDLINRLPELELPLKPESSERYNSEEFRNLIHDNINSAGNLIRIRELSSTFWDNSDYLTDKIEEYGLDINDVFQATVSILRRLKKLEIKSGKIKLSFSQSDIDRGRIRAIEGSNQIILESEELYRKLHDFI